MPKRKAGVISPSSPISPTKKHQSKSIRSDSDTSRGGPTAHRSGRGIWDLGRRYYPTERALEAHNRWGTYPPKRLIKPGDQSHSRSAFDTVKRFARHGGPDLSDVRGYPEPTTIMASSAHKRQRSTNAADDQASKKTKSSRPVSSRARAYDLNFDMILRDGNIPPSSFKNEPDNIKRWMEATDKLHASLNSDAVASAAFGRFQDAIESANIEDDVMLKIFTKIRGEERYPGTANRICLNLAPLINKDLAQCKPDYMEGLQPGFSDGRLRKALDPYIVFSESGNAPFLANHFTEVKGGGGKPDVLERQARWDGAFGVRAMHMTLNFGKQTEVFDGNAYTVTFTYSHGALKMFLHYPVQSSSAEYPRRYEMFLANSWALETKRGFREGVSAFRNAEDLAAEMRMEALQKAQSELARMPEARYQALCETAEGAKPKKKRGSTSGAPDASED